MSLSSSRPRPLPFKQALQARPRQSAKLRHRLSRFLRDEDGTVMAEFLILLPLLLWSFMALFVYWDTFRNINEGQKAAYAVADLLSRQGNVSRNFIGGMDDMMAWLLATPVNRVNIRVTSLQWNSTTQRFIVLMSESPGNKMTRLTESAVNAASFKARIPAMADADSVIIVETEVNYRPPLFVEGSNGADGEWGSLISTHVSPQVFRNFIVTRPRNFMLCLVEAPCSNAL